MLVHSVIHDFINQVVQALRGNAADIHARSFPHCLQSLQHRNAGSVIGCILCHLSDPFFPIPNCPHFYHKKECALAHSRAEARLPRQPSTLAPSAHPRGAFLSYGNEVSYTMKIESCFAGFSACGGSPANCKSRITFESITHMFDFGKSRCDFCATILHPSGSHRAF